MEAKDLLDAELTENQAEVYLEVLKSPGQTGGGISKKVSMDRSFVYNILDSLAEKGLVSYIVKERNRLYYPADPENLLKDIEEKRARISKVVQELKTIKEQTKPERSVRVYEGKAGLKAYIRDFLEADSYATLGGGGKLNILEALKYEYPHYLKEFNKKKIKGKLITSPKNKKIMKKIYQKSKVEIKTFEGLKSEVSFTIFKDKLAVYSAQEKPFVIIIEDETVAQGLKDYFDKIWQYAG
ncbi:hypothetical protein KY348_01235 [Candidatus Woesearchaeota archaeon]|nr:hypothetical protein [Candidatus Woesearchaeota archaeon]